MFSKKYVFGCRGSFFNNFFRNFDTCGSDYSRLNIFLDFSAAIRRQGIFCASCCRVTLYKENTIKDLHNIYFFEGTKSEDTYYSLTTTKRSKRYILDFFWIRILRISITYTFLKSDTTLQSLMYTKVSPHRFWPCHENGLIKTLQTIPHNLYVSFKSASLYCGLG